MMQNDTRRCEATGCSKFAEFAAKLFVPATGGEAVESKSISAFVGLIVCHEHRAALKSAEFLDAMLSDQMKATLRAMVATRSVIPPDFARAWVKTVRCDSAEFMAFEQMQATGKTRQ